MTVAVDIPKRNEIPREQTWNLEALYASPAEWDRDLERVGALLNEVLHWQGKLGNPSAIAGVLRAEDALHQLLDRLYVYAHLREDEDTAHAPSQARYQRITARVTEVLGQTAWIQPEILSQPLETLQQWRDSKELAPFRRTMDVLIRRKPHTLSNAEETLLSKAGEVFRAPSAVFGYLTNADMRFPDVEDETGTPRPLSNGRYITFMENRDRAVRRRAFETLYDTYIGFQNTFAATLGTSVKAHNFNARIRHFDSALAASLHGDNIPIALYESLVSATREALPWFYEYIDLRRDVLGIKDINMWDMHVPIVPDFEVKVEWEQAVEWVRESLRPMGDEYAEGVAECFADRWIDVMENKGKRSGAYSSGCYDSYPYILMNYQNTLDWVFTLTHELGHSMHSWLANRSQPYRYADYTIFVAEIASTTNEALLHRHLLERTDDPRFKAYLLNHLCDSFKGTVYRQTMFAEFEKLIHEMDASGEPLTAESLGERYHALNATWHGPHVEADRRIANEWSRIPHFYYNFYVYKYATGFCAAQIFARRIVEDAAAREQYLDFLKAGGSADPLDLVRQGGVDLEDPAVLSDAFATFRDSVRELRGLLLPE